MLEDKNVLITGGKSAISRATAALFKEHGANIVIADSMDKLDEGFGNYEYYCAGCNFEVSSLCDWYLTRYKAPDIWFNCINTLFDAYIDEMQDDELVQMAYLYLTMPFLLMKEMIPAMIKENHGGSIIQMCSYALAGHTGVSGYAAVNGGLMAMTNAIAVEYASDGIRANTIMPGTSLLCEDINGDNKTWEHTQMLTRRGNHIEAANLALFLASDMSNHITGEAIYVNGGQHIIPHNNLHGVKFK